MRRFCSRYLWTTKYPSKIVGEDIDLPRGTPFGSRTLLVLAFAYSFLFCSWISLGVMNVTTMSLGVEVLSAERTFNVRTAKTLASIGTDAFVCDISRFTNM